MAEKSCGLITAVPFALQSDWASNLARFTKDFRPAALILIGRHEAAAAIIANAKPLELAVLLADEAAEAERVQATGIYVTHDADLVRARAILGSSSIIGAVCGQSRHDAMEKAEAGADFIAFDATAASKWDAAAELSVWWDEISGIPAALVCGRWRPDLDLLSNARPDFLILEEVEEAAESLNVARHCGLASQA